MRKTASVPNFSQLMMFDGPFESFSLGGVTRSESVTDLNKETTRDAVVVTRPRKSLPETDSFTNQSKQFGIARPTFLNLNLNLNTLRLQPSSKPSPNTKMGLRMTTLHEEQTNSMLHNEDKNVIAEEDEPEEEEEVSPNKVTHPPPPSQRNMQFTELESYQIEAERMKHHSKGMSNSRTIDSLAELQSGKGGTPSTSSSGYGSQAVSSSNLTSDDCLSLRSISVDDTPDTDRRGSIPPSVETAESAKKSAPPVAVAPPPELPLTSSFEMKSSSEELSAPSQTGVDVESVTSTGLPPGKVVRRKKSATRMSNAQNRASFPQVKPVVTESKAAQRLEQKLVDSVMNGSIDSQSSEHTEDEIEAPVKETPIPEWVCIGESVQIRPYNSTGVIAYIGPTEFASGTWVGVDLDAPIGKNDGIVQGVRYFDARPKHGIFVRADKLIQDRRGRAMRGHETTMRRSSSRETGLSSLHRSRSRGEGISSLGKSTGRLK